MYWDVYDVVGSVRWLYMKGIDGEWTFESGCYFLSSPSCRYVIIQRIYICIATTRELRISRECRHETESASFFYAASLATVLLPPIQLSPLDRHDEDSLEPLAIVLPRRAPRRGVHRNV